MLVVVFLSVDQKAKEPRETMWVRSVSQPLAGRGGYEVFSMDLTFTLKAMEVFVSHLLHLSSLCSPYFPYTDLELRGSHRQAFWNLESQNNKRLELRQTWSAVKVFTEVNTLMSWENRLCRMHRKGINCFFFCFPLHFICVRRGVCAWWGLRSDQEDWLTEGREGAKITDVGIAGLRRHTAKIPQVYEKILNRKTRGR